MIKVFHYTSPGVRTHVANVSTSRLEEAFRLTQNIDGSWSRGPLFETGEENYDYDPRIEVVASLSVDANGKTWGLRSTMMFDEMELNDKTYVVKAAGFALKSSTPFESIKPIKVA